MGNQPQSKQAIEQCRNGKSWRIKDFAGKKHEFLDEMLGDFTTRFRPSKDSASRKARSFFKQKIVEAIISRHPRLAVFLPVVIGLAVGAGVIGTAAVTSKLVAEEESNRVVKEIRAGRQVDISNSLKNNFINFNYTRIVASELDVIRMTEAISTHATVLLHDSEDLKQELAQLASRKEKLKYTSTFAEEYWTAIKDVNMENSIGLTSAEVNRKTRLSAELSTLVTTLSPISNSSAMCRNQILTKTLLIQVIDHRRRTEIEIKGGRMIPRNLPMLHKNPHYFVIPEESVMSRETDLFGRGSHVVGRVCTASSSINASAITSTEAVSETFLLEFSGTIELNETCAGQNGSITTTHTIHSPATVTVPVLCSIVSDKFSCGAIRIRSGDTKLVHTTHHRTIITQDNLIANKVNMSNVSFVSDSNLLATGVRPGPTSWFSSITRTASSYKTTLIAVGVVIAMLAVAAVPARRMLKRTSEMGGVNITNFNSNSNPSSNSNNLDGVIANAEAGQHLPALPEPAAAEQEEEEEPEEEADKCVEIWQILKKPVYVRTLAERIAADNWARLHDPFQLHH